MNFHCRFTLVDDDVHWVTFEPLVSEPWLFSTRALATFWRWKIDVVSSVVPPLLWMTPSMADRSELAPVASCDNSQIMMPPPRLSARVVLLLIVGIPL